jgi:hypothetical protein
MKRKTMPAVTTGDSAMSTHTYNPNPNWSVTYKVNRRWRLLAWLRRVLRGLRVFKRLRELEWRNLEIHTQTRDWCDTLRRDLRRHAKLAEDRASVYQGSFDGISEELAAIQKILAPPKARKRRKR